MVRVTQGHQQYHLLIVHIHLPIHLSYRLLLCCTISNILTYSELFVKVTSLLYHTFCAPIVSDPVEMSTRSLR